MLCRFLAMLVNWNRQAGGTAFSSKDCRIVASPPARMFPGNARRHSRRFAAMPVRGRSSAREAGMRPHVALLVENVAGLGARHDPRRGPFCPRTWSLVVLHRASKPGSNAAGLVGHLGRETASSPGCNPSRLRPPWRPPAFRPWISWASHRSTKFRWSTPTTRELPGWPPSIFSNGAFATSATPASATPTGRTPARRVRAPNRGRGPYGERVRFADPLAAGPPGNNSKSGSPSGWWRCPSQPP